MRIALVFPLLEGSVGLRGQPSTCTGPRDLDYEVDLYTARLNERAWEVLAGGMDDIRGQLFSESH